METLKDDAGVVVYVVEIGALANTYSKKNSHCLKKEFSRHGSKTDSIRKQDLLAHPSLIQE